MMDDGINEDQLPEDISDEERAAWYSRSRIVDGVRVGPYMYRPVGAVDIQEIRCLCGYVAIRFNQIPLTECPHCGKPIDPEWPDIVVT